MRRWVWGVVVLVVVLAGASPAVAADPQGRWYLRNSNTEGRANATFRFAGVSGQPLVGDWDGDGTDAVGTFDPMAERWRLAPDSSSGTLTPTHNFVTDLVIDVSVIGIAGDWNGDGMDTVGVYVPATGTFFLRNSNTPGPADIEFSFGGTQPRRFVTALAGDWNGDGVDTVGLFRADTDRWRLRNANSAGPPDHRFPFGRPGSKEMGIVGDWNNDGLDTIGVADSVVDAADYVVWVLRNSNTPGDPHLSFSFGVEREVRTRGISGDWNGDGVDTVGFRLG